MRARLVTGFTEKSTSPALVQMSIAFFFYTMDAVARGLSGAVSRRGIEDGEQQRETEKPETGFFDDLRKAPP